MNLDVGEAQEWARKYAALGETRDYLLAAIKQIDWLNEDLAKKEAVIRMLQGEISDLQSKLRSLRSAWNTHMETCPQHAAMPIPSMEEIRAWRDAPSDTASA